MLSLTYCPSCTNEMQRVTVAGVDWVECPPCAGVLLSWHGLEQIFASTERSSAVLEHITRMAIVSSDHPGPVRNHAACPVCRNALIARRLGKSVAAFYYCEAHGAMFDTFTLKRLLTGVVTGVAPAAVAAPVLAAAATTTDDSSWFDGGDVLELVVDALTGLLD